MTNAASAVLTSIMIISCSMAGLAGEVFTDAVLSDAFEKGGALVAVKVLSKRLGEEFGEKVSLFTVRVVDTLVAGDLSQSDVQYPFEMDADATFGDSLAVGSSCVLFVAKTGVDDYSWLHRSNILKLAKGDPETLRLKQSAEHLYRNSQIRSFREANIRADRPVPDLPQDVQTACESFKNEKNNRNALAEAIVKSDLGSRKNVNVSSRNEYDPPKVQLSREQALTLLGPPTVRFGYEYIWFCGRSRQGVAGNMRMTFNPAAAAERVLYGTSERAYVVRFDNDVIVFEGFDQPDIVADRPEDQFRLSNKVGRFNESKYQRCVAEAEKAFSQLRLLASEAPSSVLLNSLRGGHDGDFDYYISCDGNKVIISELAARRPLPDDLRKEYDNSFRAIFTGSAGPPPPSTLDDLLENYK